MRVAAFFDLDWTLLTINSAVSWTRYELREGRFTRRAYYKSLIYLLRYRMHRIDIDTVMREALSTIKGERETVLTERIEKWYAMEVAHRFAQEALNMIESHRNAGHLLVLLSSVSSYQAHLVCRQLKLDAALASRYETRDGMFTGEPLRPICFGEGKCAYAEQFATGQRVDLARSFFYSDSISDLPMFLRVGYPRPVNPDRQLRRYARHVGWPVLSWNSE